MLILSEFAGAAAQLQSGALLVNRHDIEGVADAIHQAFAMPRDERRARMARKRRGLRAHDAFWWVDSFLRAASAAAPQRVLPIRGLRGPAASRDRGRAVDRL